MGMFSNHKRKIIEFITSDVKNESESKEFAVLLRILTFILSLYYVLTSVFIASQGHYFLGLLLIFTIGFLAASFICTYENKTKLSLILFCIAILFSSSVLTFEVGYLYQYQWTLLLPILLVFYDYAITLKTKLLTTTLVGTLLITLSLLDFYYPVLQTYSTFIHFTIITFNIAQLLFCVSTIAYFYCSKFSDSEAKIAQYNKKLIQMASLDTLTQLPNRRTMNEHLQDIIFTTKRSGEPFCIAIGDVDLFKHINDDYGHDAGDYMLSSLSQIFQDFMQDKGFVARWGGEEFLFTFEGYNIGQAQYELEKLLVEITKYPFLYKEQNFKITMTFGIEEYQDYLSIETVISKADSKLYYGKKHGRCQVVAYTH